MLSLNFEVRYVRIDDIKIEYIAIQIAVVQARRNVEGVMTGFKVRQSKFTGSVGLSYSKAHETTVIRINPGPAVNKMDARDRLRRNSVNHTAGGTVNLRTLTQDRVCAQQRHQ